MSIAFIVTACGTDDNGTSAASAQVTNCAEGSINGAGSTFVQTLAQQWTKEYQGACSKATVNYQGVGSSAGIAQFTAGTVDFAGSDVPMSTNERNAAQARYGSVLTVPWAAGGIAIEYKLSGVTDLQLSPSTLAKIMTGSITTWNDAAIAADNPGKNLPTTRVQTFHRSDGSGTTAALGAYLTATAGNDWKLGSSREVRWPGGQGVKGSDGVTAAVKATEGGITYAEVSYAKANKLGVARLKNVNGSFTGPEAANVSAALASAAVQSDASVKIDYLTPEPNAYALSTVTYLIMAKQPTDVRNVPLLKSFASYAAGSGQSSATALAYAPLSENLKASAASLIGTLGNS